MLFLIDADSIIFKAGCANERRWYEVRDKESGDVLTEMQYKKECLEWCGDDVDSFDIVPCKEADDLVKALSNAKSLMTGIVEHENCRRYITFIGGKGNYRNDVYADYKGTRDPLARPLQEQEIRDYLIKRWGAIVIDGQEVDDEIGIRMCDEKPPGDVVSVSIDKDMQNIPGLHYNYDQREMSEVSYAQASRNFYEQLLKGDSTDNIPGIKGLGNAKAKKLLADIADDDEALCRRVYEEYISNGHDYSYFIMNAWLLWIRRKRSEYWQPPCKLSVDS